MGAPIARKGYRQRPQEYWDSLIEKKQNIVPIEREHVAPKPILFGQEDFDSCKPEENIKLFCSFVRNAISQYEYDKQELTKLESQMQDLLHFIEMAKNKDTVTGYKLYKEMCEVRRQRRICKNEIELLAPVYEMFHGTKLLDQLASLQGTCSQTKKTITNKGYSIRTDILDSFL